MSFPHSVIMAVRVNITDSSVKIENVLKNTSITLDPGAWTSLAVCSEEVAKSIIARKNGNWLLHASKNIRISTSLFHNAMYIHIREWNKNMPTKGVSFHEKDWPQLSEHFVSSDESKLAKKVMTTMMRLETKNMMKERCEGCIHEYPSQRDHDCLMNASGLAYDVMDGINIKPQDFILMMAQEAVNQGLVLEKPHLAFKRVKTFLMDDIKDSIVEADYNF